MAKVFIILLPEGPWSPHSFVGGVYSTREKAEEARKQQKGYDEQATSVFIEEYEIDG